MSGGSGVDGEGRASRGVECRGAAPRCFGGWMQDPYRSPNARLDPPDVRAPRSSFVAVLLGGLSVDFVGTIVVSVILAVGLGTVMAARGYAEPEVIRWLDSGLLPVCGECFRLADDDRWRLCRGPMGEDSGNLARGSGGRALARTRVPFLLASRIDGPPLAESPAAHHPDSCGDVRGRPGRAASESLTGYAGLT